MLNNFLNALFPESCPVCGRTAVNHRTAPICNECWESISPYSGPFCDKCGKPLVSDASITCSDCLSDTPAFTSVRSYGLYKGTLKKALNLLKYYGIKRLSKPLSEKIRGISLPSVDTVIPVPLSKQKLRQRGFNQSALLAKSLAGRADTRLSLNSLVKIRDTAPQVGLSAKKRQENIKNAFAVNRKEIIINKNILLVDDVFTTGATIRECSQVLNRAGANEIYVITLAHSSSDD